MDHNDQDLTQTQADALDAILVRPAVKIKVRELPTRRVTQALHELSASIQQVANAFREFENAMSRVDANKN